MIFVTRRRSDHAFVDAKLTKLVGIGDKDLTGNQNKVCFVRSSSSGDGSLCSSGCNIGRLVSRCNGGLSGLVAGIGWCECGVPALVRTVKDTRSVRLDKLTRMTPSHGRSVFLEEPLPFYASFLCRP
jgi:hypothetical protein